MRRAALFGLFVLFWLMLINLPVEGFWPDLDSSWQGALSYFVFKGLQFGKDVIFTYGPLGYVITDTYSGYLLASRIGLDLILKGVFALLMTVTALRLRPALRLGFVLNVLLWSVVYPDALYLLAILLAACYVIVFELSPVLLLGASVLFAFLSLTKFTYCLLSVTSLSIVVGHAFTRRKWLAATALVTGYSVCVCSFWYLAGQRLAGILSFAGGAGEVASGYAEAMCISESWLAFWSGVGAVVLGTTLFVGLGCARGGQNRAPAISLLFCVGLFVAWKEGYIRADQWHIPNLYVFLLFAAPAAWAIFRPPVAHRRLLLGITLILFLLSYAVLSLARPPSVWLPSAYARIAANATAIVHPTRYRAAFDNALWHIKQENALPGMKRLIGQESVDVFGFEQAIALLNDLNYHPRPVFQGYSAYTPSLVIRNRDFYLGDAAPAFVIFKLQTADDRFAAESDAAVLEVILRDYELVAVEKGYLLWKRKAVRQPPTAHQLIREGVAAWGELLPLPSDRGPVWLQADIASSWLGALCAFCYKPARIVMIVESPTLGTRKYRLVRPLAESGFLVSPALADSSDVAEMCRHPESRSSLSITLNRSDSARLLYRNEYHYRLYAGEELCQSGTAGRGGIDPNSSSNQR